MMKRFIFALTALASLNLFAVSRPEIIVEGRINSFDKKSVKLYDNQGRVVVVPRNAIPKRFKIKPGEDVFAIIPAKRIAQQIAAARKMHQQQKDSKGKKKK